MDGFRELLACPACGGALAADWSCRAVRRALRGAGRHPQPAPARRRAHRGRAPLLRARAVPRLSAARQPAGAARAGRAQRLRAPARSGDSRRRADRRGRMRHRPDVPVPGARRSRGHRRRSDARVARARRRGRAALRPRARAVRRDRSAAARPAGPAPSTSSTRRASCTTRRTRARRSRGWRSWRGRAARSCSASTTRSRACRCGCGAWWRGCRASVSIPFDPVLRDRAARAGAARGVAARSVPASRRAPPHARRGAGAGSPRMASSTCGRIRARCSATSRRSCSRRAADNWRPRGLARAARVDAHARARGRAVLHGRPAAGFLRPKAQLVGGVPNRVSSASKRGPR